MTSTPLLVNMQGVRRTFTRQDGKEVGLRSASLQAERGERVSIVGPSGSGKSTLLNLIGLLDRPQTGAYEFDGVDVTGRRERVRDHVRRNHIGFVFQSFHVLGTRSARENLLLRLSASRTPPRLREGLIHTALEEVGLENVSNGLAGNFSGGEKQRLAIARALLGDTSLLLADEPTGNLDDENSRAVLALLDQVAQRGVAVIVITHDPSVARWADRTLSVEKGKLS